MASMNVNSTQPLMKPNQVALRGANSSTLRYDAVSRQGPAYGDLPFTWPDTVEMQSLVNMPAPAREPVKAAPVLAPTEKLPEAKPITSSKPLAPEATKLGKSPKLDVESAVSEIFERGGDLESFLEAAETAKEIKRQAKSDARIVLLEALHNGDDLHEATLKAKSIRAKAAIEAEELAMEAYAAAMLGAMDEEDSSKEIPEDEPDWQKLIYRRNDYSLFAPQAQTRHPASSRYATVHPVEKHPAVATSIDFDTKAVTNFFQAAMKLFLPWL